MDNLSIIVDDWIRALRTMDPIRSQVNVESIHENFHIFNNDEQRSLIFLFLRNIQNENSEVFIKNYISCLTLINQKLIVTPLELLQNACNPLISKYILEFSINSTPSPVEEIDAYISYCMTEPFSTLYAYTVSIIANKNLINYIPSLKKLYTEQTHLLLDYFNGKSSLTSLEYDTLLENIYAILNTLNKFGVIELNMQYKQLLSVLNQENIYSIFDPIKKKLSKIIAQLFYNLAAREQNKSFLLRQFNQASSERAKIACIHKLSETSERYNKKFLCDLITEIAQDDNYYSYAVASLVKIGGNEGKKYILNELSSGKYRRVFFTTYFLPYLNFDEEIYDAVIEDLLTYKQPLILKQALWVIRKKQMSKYLPHAIKLLFHENKLVNQEAQKVVLEAPYAKSIDHLTRTINYYGPDKQQIISHLIAKLRKLNL